MTNGNILNGLLKNRSSHSSYYISVNIVKSRGVSIKTGYRKPS